MMITYFSIIDNIQFYIIHSYLWNMHLYIIYIMHRMCLYIIYIMLYNNITINYNSYELRLLIHAFKHYLSSACHKLPEFQELQKRLSPRLSSGRALSLKNITSHMAFSVIFNPVTQNSQCKALSEGFRGNQRMEVACTFHKEPPSVGSLFRILFFKSCLVIQSSFIS